ncbi:hypothetical protein D3C72_1382340 [compost metagenome]
MAFTAGNNIKTPIVTEGVIAGAALEIIISRAALDKVIAVTADNKGWAAVLLGVTVEVFHPGIAAGNVRKIGDNHRRIFAGQRVEL